MGRVGCADAGLRQKVTERKGGREETGSGKLRTEVRIKFPFPYNLALGQAALCWLQGRAYMYLPCSFLLK